MSYQLHSHCDGNNCSRLKKVGKGSRRSQPSGHGHSHEHDESQDLEQPDVELQSIFSQRFILKNVEDDQRSESKAQTANEAMAPRIKKKRLSGIWILIGTLIVLSITLLAASQSQEARRIVGSYVDPITSTDIVNRTLHVTQIRRIFNYFSPLIGESSSKSLIEEKTERFKTNIDGIQERMAAMEAAIVKLTGEAQTDGIGPEIEDLREKYNALIGKIESFSHSDAAHHDISDGLEQMKPVLSGLNEDVDDFSENRNDWRAKIDKLMVENEKMQREIDEMRIRIQSLVKTDCQSCTGASAISGTMTLKDINAVIASAISKYDADKTGLPDYASEPGGGSIVGVRCTESYAPATRQETVFGIPIFYKEYSPRTVIQPGFAPGECWAFKGSHGYLVIKLSGLVEVSAVSYEHISKEISPTGNIDSAPKHFEIHALANEKEEEGLRLGKFTYDANGPALQYFPVQVADVPATNFIELRVMSNYGHPVYTCLYRLRVHGKRVESNHGTVN